MNDEDINNYLPSILNPRAIKKINKDISLTQCSTVSRASLSLKRGSKIINIKKNVSQSYNKNKENLKNNINCFPKEVHNVAQQNTISDINSIGFSAIEDINSLKNDNSSLLDCVPLKLDRNNTRDINKNNTSIISISSPTEIHQDHSIHSDKTVDYNVHDKPLISLSFSVSNCDNVDINTKKSNIKKVLVSRNKNNIDVDCDIIEGSELSEESMNNNINMNDSLLNSTKRKAVAVNLEIKKQKLTGTEEKVELPKILILNTNAIEKLTHIIVQPPNYKLVKRKINDINNYITAQQKSPYVSVIKHGQSVKNEILNQKPIDTYFKSDKTSKINHLVGEQCPNLVGNVVWTGLFQAKEIVRNDAPEMNRNSGIANVVGRTPYKFRESLREPGISLSGPQSPKPRASSSRSQNGVGPFSPKRNVDFNNLQPVTHKANKTPTTVQNIPHHKIITGTHFAVDAFSYGEIPNVKHYFLTHFHSDHYVGLSKSFSHMLFCSKITAQLCISRLGVNYKRVHVINLDETILIDGVEVTAVDANHCPGSLMFVFTLPNGKTILHTGDFRATDEMESYPVFWNNDVHTIYLDTTYCHPRYDFPKQDKSLEIAVNLLREKKAALEKVGKSFSSVLIVCGTYTIGKEKFFIGLANRVGCSIWLDPEKEQVLEKIEEQSLVKAPRESCQLHVVSVRDLTHEKLRRYLADLNGVFDEVVAFKPSGWENGKKTTYENDCVTIHGVPYSEHSSFKELIRFVNFLKPRQVIPTVYIPGGINAVQKYFPCPIISKEDIQNQSKITDYFLIRNQQQVPTFNY